MDFDTLIFLLVFLAVVISNIKKIIAESKKKDGVEKKDKGSLQKLIRKVSARIQEEIVPGIKEPASRESVANEPDTEKSGAREFGFEKFSGWEALISKEIPMTPHKDQEQDFDQDEEESASLETITIEPDSIEPELPEPAIYIEPEPVVDEKEEKIETVREGISLSEKATESTELIGPSYTVNELRRAIVWSEIIAPPVGLREE